MLTLFIGKLFGFTALRVAPGAGGAEDCSGTITETEALQAEDARYKAQTNNDFAAMQKLFGDDLVYVHSTAAVDTKAGFIESMRSGSVKFRRMERREAKVRAYGYMALITGHARFEVTVNGVDRTIELLFHSIWAKRSAGMQFVSWQATMLPPKQ